MSPSKKARGSASKGSPGKPRGSRADSPAQVETYGDVVLDSIADGVFTVDRQWRITSFNRAAEETIGIARDEAVGKPCCEVFRANVCERDCVLRRTMESGEPVINKQIWIVATDGRRIPISVSTALLRDRRGDVIGGVETFRDLSLVERLRRELAKQHAFEDIVSRSHLMHGLFAILPEVAESGSTVLIEGESGTGKELLARAIHHLSGRKRKPFVAVNCGALPDTLLESELFGYEAGAFTDARKPKKGRFALAAGGTLFLDEIGDVSPALQVRLLRVLQERQYEPLGGVETIKADVRVICATNRDLQALTAEGRFRQDLYYRVNVVRLRAPPLRERREDIPPLVEHFIARFNALRGKDVSGVSDGVMARLMRHDWPGNVRELENAMEHAFILCRGPVIEPQHLPGQFLPVDEAVVVPGMTLAEIEARAIRDALERNGWNRLATARELGIDKTTLWRKLKRLGLAPPGGEG
ncbi:MAG: sigma 54-interacting transcriptional regulator [Phycisphaerae bacterium]|nr:sigma 54-interacting transcriptional regulator [Phycisphaerae bacterium]